MANRPHMTRALFKDKYSKRLTVLAIVGIVVWFGLDAVFQVSWFAAGLVAIVGVAMLLQAVPFALRFFAFYVPGLGAISERFDRRFGAESDLTKHIGPDV